MLSIKLESWKHFMQLSQTVFASSFGWLRICCQDRLSRLWQQKKRKCRNFKSRQNRSYVSGQCKKGVRLLDFNLWNDNVSRLYIGKQPLWWTSPPHLKISKETWTWNRPDGLADCGRFIYIKHFNWKLNFEVREILPYFESEYLYIHTVSQIHDMFWSV